MAELKSKSGMVGTFSTVAKWSVGEGKSESKEGTFTGPADAASVVGFLQGASADEREAFFKAWLYGADLKKKANLRPAVAAESPWISRDGIKLNLATGERIKIDTGLAMAPLPIEKCIGGVNNALQSAVDLGTEPQAALLVARRMLLENKLATESNGKLVAVKK